MFVCFLLVFRSGVLAFLVWFLTIVEKLCMISIYLFCYIAILFFLLSYTHLPITTT